MPIDPRAAKSVGWVRERVGLEPDGRPLLHRLGIGAWSLIGIIALLGLVIYGLARISSVVLPLLFAVVFAVLFHPLARLLKRRGLPPAAAAGAVVLAIILLSVGVVALTVKGIVDQSERIGDEITEALDELDVDQADIDAVRARLEESGPGLQSGLLDSFVSGVSVVGEFVVGLLLGVLIFYYLLKDGPELRRALVSRAPPDQMDEVDGFVDDTFHVLRRYWLGRTIVSAVVASVVGVAALILGLPLVFTIILVTFIGGFVPYVGAVVGGALAVLVALGGSGLPAALIMLAVTLVANLVIENLVEPPVTGRTLRVHPLVVLLATTVGGILGGLAGMVMGVPVVVIGQRAVPVLLHLLEGVERRGPTAHGAEPATEQVTPPG